MKNNIPQGYKATALGIIPQEWEVKRLGEICTYFKSGEGITSKDISENGQYPVYGGNGLRGYTDKKYTHDGAYILIGRQGALCGNINYVTGKCYISEHAIAVQTKGDLSWLRYKLDFWNLNRYSESSAQPGLSVEKLVRYKLTVPPLAEQRKIAEVLGVWDEAIEKQARLIEKLDLRKRALMQRLLSAKLRLPGFSEPWQKVKFCELFTKSIKTADPLKKYEVLSVTKEGIVAQKSYFNKDIASEDTSKYIVVERGDLAMSGLNFWMGSCHILTNFNEGIISPAYKVFKVNEHNNIDFIRDFVRSSMFLQALQGCSVIGASIVRRNLDKEMLYEWIFKIPSLKEQTAIAEVLTAADREIELAKEKLERLRRQKRGLMQQLLTGKKRVNL
ncbi:MAG TPA: restriction endonuclease subunit S [Candidatus Alistipes faecavium]|nr:restriction endonuclease subunit S [Candidatus Alistipes faecavium]